MNKPVAATILVVALSAVWITPVPAQKTTEVYIPIGDSPGVSVSNSLYGKISRIDYESRSMELLDRHGTRSVRMSDTTLYYLDRSKYGKKNSQGSIDDCEVGQTVEIYVTSSGDVKWVKIGSS